MYKGGKTFHETGVAAREYIVAVAATIVYQWKNNGPLFVVNEQKGRRMAALGRCGWTPCAVSMASGAKGGREQSGLLCLGTPTRIAQPLLFCGNGGWRGGWHAPNSKPGEAVNAFRHNVCGPRNDPGAAYQFAKRIRP